MKKSSVKNLSKILVIMLSVALFVTGLVFAVSADTGYVAEVTINGASTQFTTFEAAIAAANGKEATIKLLKDVTISSTYQPSATTVLDLNGHTITTDAALDANNSPAFRINVDFTIAGNGKIIVNSKRGFVTATGGDFKIIGEAKPIEITKSESAQDYPIIEIAGTDVFVKNAVLELKNDSQGQGMVYVDSSAGAISFEGVEMKALYGNAPEYTEGSSVSITGGQSIFNIAKTESACPTISLSYCSIDAVNFNGIIYGENKIRKENFIVIEDSHISLRATRNEYNTTIFASWVNIASDIIIKDSYVEYGGKTAVSTNTSGSALIFDNTTIASSYPAIGNNNYFRHGKVILKNGSALITYSDNKNNIATNGTTPNVFFEEGTRFDEVIKNKVLNLTAGQVVFPDGNAPKDNTAYTIVFDPSGNEAAPYVIRAVGTTTPYVNHSNSGITSYNGGQTAGLNELNKLTDNNFYYQFTKTADGEATLMGVVMGANNMVQASDKKILVFEYDVTADPSGGFAPFLYSIHSRNTSGGNNRKKLYDVNASGTLVPVGYQNGDKESVNLVLGEWNHITLVVDTTYYTEGSASATSYLYVNGTYLGYNTSSYQSNSGPIHGQIIEFPNPCPVGATLLIDNATARLYDSENHLTKEDADNYLINGGKVNADFNKPGLITISGVPIYDINEALKLQQERGFIVSLEDDIKSPQSVYTEGVILLNGHTMEISEDSIPVDITDESYTFHKRVDGVKTNVSTYSDFGFNLYIPEKYQIISATCEGINYKSAISSAVIDGKLYSKITVYRDAHKASSDVTLTIEFEKCGTRQYTINLASYAEKVLQSNEATINDTELIYFMLTYANEAEKYFGIADDKIEAILSKSAYFAEANTNDYAYEATTDDLSSIFSSAAIDIKSNDLSYVFTLTENAPAFKLTLAERVYTNENAENGILRINGLKIYKFSEDITVEAEGINAVYNLDTILDYYVKEAEKGENEYSKALPLLRAFFNYSNNSGDYRAEKDNAEQSKYKVILLGENSINDFSILVTDETRAYAEEINDVLIGKINAVLPIITSAEEAKSGKIINISVVGSIFTPKYQLSLNGEVFTISAPTTAGIEKATDAFINETGIASSEERVIEIPADFSFSDTYEVSYPSNIYLKGDVVGDAFETPIGEDVTFHITLNADGKLIGADQIKCEVHRDNKAAITEYHSIESGEVFVTVPGLDQPGLVQMTVTLLDADGNAVTSPEVKSITIGAFVEGESITNAKGTPDDFSTFWQELINELYTVDPFDTSAPSDDQDSENYYHITKITAENITYYKEQTSWQSYGRNITVDALNYVDIYEFALKAPGEMPSTGFITIPKDTSKTYPIRLTTCGYGIYRAFMKWDTDCISVSMNTHGLPNMGPHSDYQFLKTTSVANGGLNGYGTLASDYANPEEAYFTYVLLRNMQALRFAKSYAADSWNGTITAEGASQAGFQSIAAAALATLTNGDINISSVYATVPWLCDIGGDVLGRKVCQILSYHEGVEYFDSANFAKLISSATTVTIKGGFADPTVSPTGVISIYNNLNCPKTLIFVQNHDHSSAPKQNGIEHVTSKDFP